MPPEPPVIVKLGGSLLTRKRGSPAVRAKVIARLSAELARVVPQVPLVLLHGAGSYGHPGAVRWHLAEPPGGDSQAHRIRGAAIVQAEVRRLHAFLMQNLLDAGLAPWSIPPSMVARNRGGRLAHFVPTPFSESLARQTLPVAFGDVVPDETWEFSILSADTIAVELVRRLQAKRVVFASDVPGVLDPQSRGRPKVLLKVTSELVGQLTPTPGTPDVTGGIRGKVEAMLAIQKLGADAGLISGLSDGALSRAVRGENVYGTWVQGATN